LDKIAKLKTHTVIDTVVARQSYLLLDSYILHKQFTWMLPYDPCSKSRTQILP